MDSEGMEGKHRKIFGSNSKVSNPKGQTYMFGMDSVGKYSVQIQKFQIQRVKPIRSKHFTAKNIRFKFKSVDFKGLTLYVRNGFRWKIFRLKMGYL